MAGTSTKTVIVCFRMPVDTYGKIEDATETCKNKDNSVADYCKREIERFVWRHDPDKKTKEQVLERYYKRHPEKILVKTP